MKKFFKTLAIGSALILSLGTLSGCGKDNSKLVMGTNAAFPPFEYTATNGLVGEYDGIDVAIAQKIAEKAGKELAIEDMKFEGLITAVKGGKVDMVVAGMTATDERKESVDFSDTYYVASQVIVKRADDDSINSAEDLKNGKKVGVVLGYTGDSIVTEDLGIEESNIQRANSGSNLIIDVKNGKLDAVVIDSYTGKAFAEKNGLVTVDDSEVFETEEYAIAVKKGNTELLNTINETLKEMKESGEIEKLAAEYNDKAASN